MRVRATSATMNIRIIGSEVVDGWSISKACALKEQVEQRLKLARTGFLSFQDRRTKSERCLLE